MMLVVMTLMEMCSAAAQPFVLVLRNLFVMVMEGMIVAIQIIRLEFYGYSPASMRAAENHSACWCKIYCTNRMISNLWYCFVVANFVQSFAVTGIFTPTIIHTRTM